MRDAHRMKEKFDLSLDNRQIVSLLIGGIVVLGAVFVLGVVVGKKLAGNQTAAQAPDLLTALDQKAEVPLTFQEELTKKAPQTAPPPPTTAAAPVAVAKVDAAKPEPAKIEVPPAQEPEKDEPSTPEPKLADPNQAEPNKTQLAVAHTPEVSGGQADLKGKVEDDVVATRTATKDGNLKDAFARVAKPTDAKTGGAWTLQISASQSKEEADKFLARLRDRGYAPFIVKAEVPGRGTWYRVRMGNFPSKEAASRYLQDFRRETQIPAFVAAND